ncbi:limonene-1,2-epoxide hydrolase family protein [Mycobacterium sp.]|uniref:limonene-1,2-epoxide hydrolase family protein n=1 Tax=Mycobacterium sp. TaxID=1785 RepID=UPI002603B761|nr:limonene-1,2-epoxide hydrolase family protein [Mycobacterium sp.]
MPAVESSWEGALSISGATPRLTAEIDARRGVTYHSRRVSKQAGVTFLCASVTALSQRADGKVMTAEEVVRAEIAAWSRNDVDEVMSHFAKDATFDIGPSWPRLSGRDAIHEMMKAFFARGTCVDLEILHLAVDGEMVLMERRDHWLIEGKQMSWPVMGAYQVHGEKIKAWREYFYPPNES